MQTLTEEQVVSVKNYAATMRKEIIKMITKANSGHPGGSLSITDVMALLYCVEMNVSADNPQNPDRDRLVLSKGHAAPALYAALALKGFFPMEELSGLRKINCMLQGHPDMKHTPGVDMSTGSLGQGISASCGIALAGKLDHKDYHVFTIMGDGEQEEGQVWEAAMLAAHYKLDNLTAFLDNNGLQIDGKIDEVMCPEPLPEKWRAFGWHVIEANGHDVQDLHRAIGEAKAFKGKPTMIVMHTIKGKGVPEMENQAGWHGKAPSQEQCAQFLAELDGEQ
jgi:transketolase